MNIARIAERLFGVVDWHRTLDEVRAELRREVAGRVSSTELDQRIKAKLLDTRQFHWYFAAVIVLSIRRASGEVRRSWPSSAHRQARALLVLDAWAVFLPARIAREDLGDYLEDINRRAALGQSKLVWLRVLAAMFWTAVSALGYLRKKLQRRSGA